MTNVTSTRPLARFGPDGEAADDAPVIATLALDAASHAAFDALRRRYFPPERLVVGAHVTMFHALPASQAAEIAAFVTALCAKTPRFRLHLAGARFLGRGVALDLSADEAHAVRGAMRARFAASLTAQDQARWLPHVTVQNKAAPEDARLAWRHLQTFAYAAPILAEGIALWRYRAGPWEAIETCAFAHPRNAAENPLERDGFR